MKDWRNTITNTLIGALITFAVMFISITRTMVTEDQLDGLATQTEIIIIKENITKAMDNHTRAIERLAKEVGNLRESVGRLEGRISTFNNNN